MVEWEWQTWNQTLIWDTDSFSSLDSVWRLSSVKYWCFSNSDWICHHMKFLCCNLLVKKPAVRLKKLFLVFSGLLSFLFALPLDLLRAYPSTECSIPKPAKPCLFYVLWYNLWYPIENDKLMWYGSDWYSRAMAIEKYRKTHLALNLLHDHCRRTSLHK